MQLRSIAPCLAIAVVALGFGCTKREQVTERMTWECAPEEYKSGYYARPDEYVRFRYIREPQCFVLASARDFCSILNSSGKHEVRVTFDLWKTGYRMQSVEGQRLHDVEGWGSSGRNGEGSCPLERYFH